MSDVDYLDTVVQFQNARACISHSKNIIFKNIHFSGRESGLKAEFSDKRNIKRKLNINRRRKLSVR